MNAAPFDIVAAEYDAAFTEHRLGRWLREAVWAHLDTAFAPGDHVLELGCGTGEDAVYLARRGVQVHATDRSIGMLAVARHKAAVRGVTDRITFEQLDMRLFPCSPAHRTVKRTYDGGFSNFGALNALPDFHALASILAHWIRPGGRVLLVVMGPLCPWEWGWHLAHGQVRTAFQRLHRDTVAHIGHGTLMRVWYPSPRRLRQAFSPYFRHQATVGVGVVLPPTFARGLVDRRPGLFERLAVLDRRAGRTFPGTWLNDHYLACFERTEHALPALPASPPEIHSPAP